MEDTYNMVRKKIYLKNLYDYEQKCDNGTRLNCEQLVEYNRCETFEEREENNPINHIHIGTKVNRYMEDRYRNSRQVSSWRQEVCSTY